MSENKLTPSNFEKYITRKAESDVNEAIKSLEEHFNAFFKYNNTLKISGGWWELNEAWKEAIKKNKAEYVKQREIAVLNEVLEKLDSVKFLFESEKSRGE